MHSSHSAPSLLARLTKGVSILALALSLFACDVQKEGVIILEKPSTVTEIEFTSWSDAVAKIRADHTGEKLTPNSSTIQQAEYFAAEGKGYLLVQFVSNPGKDFLYASVPVAVWEKFKAAGSKGAFFNAEIRGNYEAVLKGSTP